MQKTKQEQQTNVVPFTGYLQPQIPPTTEKQTVLPSTLTFMALLFAGGLAIGAISVHQSADYSQLENLKTQASKLSEIQKKVCTY